MNSRELSTRSAKTVSEPAFLGYGETLAIIDELRSAISEHVAREKELVDAHARKKYQYNKSHSESLTTHDQQAAMRQNEVAAGFDSTLEAARDRNDRRTLRINRARENLDRKLREDLEQCEGSGAFRLQRNALLYERQRIAAREAVEAKFRERKAWMAKAEATFARAVSQSGARLRCFPQLAGKIGRPDPDATADISPETPPAQLFEAFREQMVETVEAIKALKKKTLLAVLGPIPLPVWIILLTGCQYAMVIFELAHNHLQAGLFTGGTLLVLVALLLAGYRAARPSAGVIIPGIARLSRYLEICRPLVEADYANERNLIEEHYQRSIEDSQNAYEQSLEDAEQMRTSRPGQLAEKHARILEHHHRQAAARTASLNTKRNEGLARLTANLAAGRDKLVSEHEAWLASEQSATDAAMEELLASWNTVVKPKLAQLAASSQASRTLFPEWSSLDTEHGWTPVTQAGKGVRFGHIEIDAEQLAAGLPECRLLAMSELRNSRHVSAPLHLSFPNEGSFLIDADSRTQKTAIACLNNLILRLLASLPPGKVDFTIIDPVGLGENFSSLMHLADYEEAIIHNRIWTQSQQIDQRLTELTEHMEKVIQMYLRNDYQTIVDYNEQAGNIAEKYHFLVIADFPAAFSEQAASRLLSIASAGGKCGVFTIIFRDPKQAPPIGINSEELEAASVHVGTSNQGTLILPALQGEGITLQLDSPPDEPGVSAFLHRIGSASVDSSRVEVPFDHVAPSDAELWTARTPEELVVPIGRTGATKLQQLAIGKGTRQHALIAGKTGSGKSTLFHVIITNLSLWCSPDEVEFYLVDFKKGVEFKTYANRKLPHARVIAIESDREFGLSVLRRVDDELRRRGEAFRNLGVQNVAAFLEAGGKGPLPRTLLLIDEFQELFTEEDRIAQEASVLLDRIVRQGRAFGIHVILGSQTLGGAFTLARTTLGQMAIRVALMCDEADAYLIMDENNPGPRLLARPGEGIYNDMAGKMEGNSPFQVVWLPDEVRDAQLDRLMAHALSSGRKLSEPVVFEGNVPAAIAQNHELGAALAAPSGDASGPVRIWLGSPNSIKGPSHARLHRAGGNHLMLVGTREDAALSILSIAMLSLGAQFRHAEEARIVFIDSTSPASPENHLVRAAAAALPRPVDIIRAEEIEATMTALEAEFQRRSAEGADGKPPVFLLIHCLQKFKILRYEDDFSFSMDADAGSKAQPGNQLNEILCEGAGLGIHVLFSCDTHGNLGRFLSRKAQQECELRVLFQMSANDSAALIDTPRASTLGLNRGLFYNGQEGHLEVFHPYALPDASWFREAGAQIGKG